MKRALKLLGDESGQATTEYISTTFLLFAAGLGATASWPFTKLLFDGLQRYVDLYYFALNVAIG